MSAKTVAPLPAIAAAIFTLTAPVWLEGKSIFPSGECFRLRNADQDCVHDDELYQHLPLSMEVDRRLSRGDLPLWAPQIGLGMPLLAYSDALVVDPLRHVLRLFAPTSRHLTFRLLILVFFAAWAMHGLFRVHGAPFAASQVAALWFVALVLRQYPVDEPLMHFAGTCWTAIALFFLAVALRRDDGRAFAAAALSLGAAWVGGHPHPAYAGSLLCAAYVVLQRRSIVSGATAIALGAAIGAIQILPAWDFATQGTHNFSAGRALESTESVRHLWALFYGMIGPTGVALALIGGLQLRRSPALALAGLAALFWLMSGGWIYAVLRAVVPFFSYFKVGSKFFASPFPILMAALAGFAVERIVLLAAPRRRLAQAAVAVAASYVFIELPYAELYAMYAYPEAEHDPPPPCVGAVRRAIGGAGGGRLVRYRTRALPPNMGLIWGIRDVQASTSQIAAGYASFYLALNPTAAGAAEEDGDYTAIEDPARLDHPSLDLAGATVLLAGEEVTSSHWKLVASDPDGFCFAYPTGWWVYERTTPPPRARLDPAVGTAEITRDTGDEIEVEVTADASQPATLVLADLYMDGWEAEIDGAPAAPPQPVARAGGLFRSVAVPPGIHTVRFVYRPLSFRLGAALSLAALGAAAAWAWRRRRRG